MPATPYAGITNDQMTTDAGHRVAWSDTITANADQTVFLDALYDSERYLSIIKVERHYQANAAGVACVTDVGVMNADTGAVVDEDGIVDADQSRNDALAGMVDELTIASTLKNKQDWRTKDGAQVAPGQKVYARCTGGAGNTGDYKLKFYYLVIDKDAA